MKIRKNRAAAQSGKTNNQKQKVLEVSELVNQKSIKATQNHIFIDNSIKKKPAAPPGSADLHRKPYPLLYNALIVVIYLFAFIILDIITKQFQELPGIVAWYPPVGLTYALLLVFGLSFTPAVTIALLIDSVFIYRMPQPTYLLFLWALIISLIYGAAAAFLRHRIHLDWQLHKFRDVTWFIFTTVIVSALLAVLSVSSSALSSNMPQSEIFIAIFHWWIGETVGVLTITPFLLILVMPRLKRFTEGQRVKLPTLRSFPRPTLAVIGQAASLAFTLYWVFGTHVLYEFHPLYLISLPLIWIALDHGFKGVTAGIVALNFGMMLALWLFRSDLANLGELQLLVIINCIVGLLMGAVVTERKQADETSHKGEKRFRALIEHSLEEISLVDSDGTLTYESPTSRRPLGYPPNSFVGYNIIDLFHPDDRAATAQLLKQVIKHPGSVKEALFRLRHQDGSWRWMESSLTNLLDEPAIQSVVINYRDITERKRDEEALRYSHEETTHANRLLLALSRAAQAVQRARTIENVYSAIQNQVTQMGYSASGFELSEDGRSLRIAYLSYKADLMHKAEKIIGLSPRNFHFHPRVDSIYQKVIDKGETVFVKDAAQAVADTLPKKLRVLAQPMSDLFKLSQSIFTPLKVDDKMIGLMAFTGPGLTETDTQAVTVFASQAAIAIQNARLYEQAQQEITTRKQAEENIKISNDELSMLFELSHSLAEADNLDDILDLVNRHAVESIHTTFARIALLEDGIFVMRAAYPIRVIGSDFRIGERNPVTSLPYSQRILEKNEPMILQASDPGISDEEKKVLLLDFAQSLCLIPLRISDSSPMSENLMGLLMLGEARNEGREPFTPEKMRLAQTIGDSAAIAIRRMLLREQTEHRLQQLIALSEIDLAIISNSGMVFSLQALLLQVIKQLKVDAADVWLFNPTLQALEFVTGRGFRTPAFENAKPLHLGEGNAGRAALERRTIHVSNLTAHENHPRLTKALAKEPFIGYYAVPLIVKDQVKGVLELFLRTELESNKEWLKFLDAFANQAAIAIDNSSLFNDLQHSNSELTQAYDATIQGWSQALDLRDKETEGHTQRVTEQTTRLGRQFGLPEEELIHVRRGALLHDIGKMGVPDGILLKPGPLTDEEWIVMRKHTTFAYELLSPIHFLQPALDIPYCHHEKWDGTGYPRGLSGDQIPFAARIFAVVDVWDALTSDRPYRAAWPEEKVLDHIRSLAGTHFDPQVVNICLELGLLKDQPKRKMQREQVQWSEKFGVGVRELDLQHQQLVKLLNRLISATGTISTHSETISSILKEMTRYAQVHFKTEERLMATYGYPGLEEQKIQHRDFRKKTADFSTTTTLGVEQKPEALLEYLADWLTHHILEYDMAYRSFFKEKGVK